MATRLMTLAAGLSLLAGATGAAAQTFDCLIDPAQVLRLGGVTSGSLASVQVERGDLVEAGQVVATLDSDLERASIELLRLRANSRETIEAYQAELDLARKQLERVQALVERNVASVATIDELIAEVSVAERNVANAELDQKVAQMELRRAEVQLERRQILSPISGLVVNRLLSPGEYLTADGSVVILAQLDPLHVEVFVPTALYGQIEVGGTALVTPEEPIGGEYQAVVTTVDQVFDTASGTFGVRLTLPNPDRTLPGGLRCQVTFGPGNQNDQLK